MQSIYDKGKMLKDIAIYSRSIDVDEMLVMLPDPDPVLKKYGEGVEVLERLTSDERVISAIQQRKLGTLKKEFMIEAVDDKALRVKEEFEKDIERIDIENVINGMLDAVFYGFSPCELVWSAEDGNLLRLKDIKVLPVRWFAFNSDREPVFLTQNNPEEGEPLPVGKFVFVRHFPTYDNPYGLRLLSRVLFPVLFKKGGISFWMKFMEKFGIPYTIGKYRPGATKEEKDELMSKLKMMVQDAVAVIPDGNSIEILEAKSQGNGVLFERFKIAMDNAITVALLGQTLTTDVKGYGSYAAGKVHQDILEQYQEADQKLVKKAFDKILRIYTDINFGMDYPSPEFKWYEDEDLQLDRSKRDRELSDNLKFTKKYYMKHYGLEEDEFEVKDEGGRLKDEEGASFKESDNKDAELDKMTDALPQGARFNLEKILEEFENSKDFEEALAKVSKIYPFLKDEEVERLLEMAIFSSEVYGAGKD